MVSGLYDCFQCWGQVGTIWAISDTHFSESAEESGFRNKPPDDEIVAAINKRVGKNDTLLLLGDVGNIEPVRRLRGYKVLIMGNHDKGKTKYLRKIKYYQRDPSVFAKEEAIKSAQEIDTGKITSMKEYYPFPYWLITNDNQLFDEVYEGPLFIGEKIVLSHEPLPFDFALNIHGHLHGHTLDDPYHLSVVSDTINYDPINVTRFLNKGGLAAITSLHRSTIDEATERRAKYGPLL